MCINNKAELLLLPRNHKLEEEFYIYENTVHAINKVLSNAGVENRYLNDKPIQLLEQRSVEWFVPLIYISHHVLVENKEIYESAFIAIKDYLNQISSFTRKEEHTVKVEVHVEKTKSRTLKIIKYNGPINGLEILSKDISKVLDE